MNLHRLGAAINALARLSPKLAGRIALRLFITPKRIAYVPDEAIYLSEAEQLQLDWDLRFFKSTKSVPRVGNIHFA